MQERTAEKKNRKYGVMLQRVRRWLVWFAVTIGGLMFLFWLSACIPKASIRDNVWESAQYLLGEELYDQWRPGDRRTEIHNYADAISLNIAYSVGSNRPWEDILISPLYSDHVNMEKSVTQLLAEEVEGNLPADTIYDRYWHGMILVLRPLLLVFSLQEIRLLFLMILFGLLFGLMFLLARRQQRGMAVLVFVAAALVQLPITAFCIEYIPTVLLMLSFSIAMIFGSEDREKIIGLCVADGVCVAFFDFLTTETLAIVVPLALCYGLWEKKNQIQGVWKETKFLMRALMSWGLAYVGCYVTKWCLSGAVLGENRVGVALQAFFNRQEQEITVYALDSLTHGMQLSEEALQTAGGEVLPLPLSAVMMNFRLWLGLSGKITLEELALALVFLLGAAACMIYLYKNEKSTTCARIWMVLGCIPLLRMMVLSGHSMEHCFFVYRSLFGTLVCFTAGFYYVIDWNKVRGRRKR